MEHMIAKFSKNYTKKIFETFHDGLFLKIQFYAKIL